MIGFRPKVKADKKAKAKAKPVKKAVITGPKGNSATVGTAGSKNIIDATNKRINKK